MTLLYRISNKNNAQHILIFSNPTYILYLHRLFIFIFSNCFTRGMIQNITGFTKELIGFINTAFQINKDIG